MPEDDRPDPGRALSASLEARLPSATRLGQEPAYPPPRPAAQLLAGTAATVRLDQDAWQVVDLVATPRTEPAAGAPAAQPPPLTTPGLEARLSGGDLARYEVGDRLGAGATGSVWAVLDRSLQRPLAVKVLDGGGITAFVDEARIAAALEHPNVLPVHDLDLAADGRPFFTMKRIEGRSLGDAIADSTIDHRHELVRDANAIVAIVLGVANALAYAHHRGVIHQDVKPDNIMLGAFGEVLLVDWGSAQRLDLPRKLSGTPLYMAPEQARRAGADQRSDVYCLGATLLHALTLRLPTSADTIDVFWRKKRDGEVDPPTADERRHVPAPLLAIALKAMAADPAQRYQAMDEFIADLKAYQAGLAVSAQREPWWKRLWRWFRRHARAFAIVAPMASTAVLLVLVVFGDQLKAMATWGSPVFHDDFSDPALPAWIQLAGGFEARDGAAVSTGFSENMLALRQRFDGDVAIEYDAWLTPGTTPGDLSLLWCPKIDLTKRWQGIDYDRALQLQFGAHEGAFTVIQLGHHLAFADARPEPGHRYRVRVELRDNLATLAIDGRVCCRYVDPLPLEGGNLVLYGSDAGKAFSRVRVSVRHPGQLVAATAVGDWLLREGSREQAAVEYARVADSHPGSELARIATYRQGLARWYADDRAGAEDAWRLLAGTPWADEAAMVRIDAAIAEDRHGPALAEIERLAASSPSLGERLGYQWCTAIQALVQRTPTVERRAAVESFLPLRERRLAQPGTKVMLARALLFLERWQEVLDRCPGSRWECCLALSALGRPEEIASRYPEQANHIHEASLAMGRYEDVPIGPLERCEQGRAEEAYRLDPRDSVNQLSCGHFEFVSGHLHPDAERWNTCYVVLSGHAGEVAEAEARRSVPVLMALGRVDEAAALGEEFPRYHAWPRHLIGLRAWIAGNRARAESLFTIPPQREFTQQEIEVARTAIVPFLRELGGDRGALARACADTIARCRWVDKQRRWHLARYLIGEIDDAALLAQPYRQFAQSDLHLARAIRAELRGDGGAAATDYRAYRELPTWRRGLLVDPVRDEFAAWRLSVLELP